MKTYEEVTEYLFSQLPMFQRLGRTAFKKDLTNIKALSEIMGFPEYSVPMIHIAGTNGKGSVSHILSALLQSNGLSVGLYTSPHYVDFRERVRINHKKIPEDNVVNFVNQYKEEFDQIQPSFFEWSFALALHYFQQKKPDIAIIETGLGGRLDSTNIVEPLLTIITNVSLDHQAFLGDTIPEIASEKLGIVKTGIPLVLGEKSHEYNTLAIEKARESNATLYFSEDIIRVYPANENDTDSFLKGQWVTVEDDLGKGDPILVDLDGDYQIKNLQTALASYLILSKTMDLKEDVWKSSSALSQIRRKSGMIGRWQVVESEPPVILDGAHNLAALNAVIQSFLNIDAERQFIILGISDDKDVDALLEKLPRFVEYHFTQASVPRALHFSAYIEKAKVKYGLRVSGHESITAAYRTVRRKASHYDAVLITGSIFLVGEWFNKFSNQ
ncbi:MAG: bifunctional folylpolyglutamate synthase/dihydrofolate synthase [Bacteroidetes bacterium]|jgi:dihydrofolate synthase/folylpolyglutamate synthase|nr:bifunctional folylpolyglutamate synthase/dihydrofolate synthase [Bacteroidota bacterium]